MQKKMADQPCRTGLEMNELIERLDTMSQERRHYALEALPLHLALADEESALCHLLTTFDFLQAKLNTLGLGPLIEDFEGNERLKSVQDALRLSQYALHQ